MEPGVRAALLHEVGVAALLDDAAVLEDEDAVGVAQGGEAVSDEDDGAIGAGRVAGEARGPLGQQYCPK